MFDHRKTERCDYFDEKIEYALDSFSKDELLEAELINFNESGLCILSSKQLSAGQEITLRNFMGASYRSAVVAWVAEYERFSNIDKTAEILFKIGLRFSD